MFKKWLLCSWIHYKHHCYPEVWNKKSIGPWHCTKCHPCGEGFDNFLESKGKDNGR